MEDKKTKTVTVMELSNADKEKIADLLISVFGIKEMPNGLYQTGYGPKTKIGIYGTAKSIMDYNF